MVAAAHKLRAEVLAARGGPAAAAKAAAAAHVAAPAARVGCGAGGCC
jgi:hypothetical protein